MWTIYDRRCAPHQRVPVSEWQTHCEELDSDTIERQYEEDLASLQLTSSQSAVVVPGSTVEIVNLEKLEELTGLEKPNGLMVFQAPEHNSFCNVREFLSNCSYFGFSENWKTCRCF